MFHDFLMIFFKIPLWYNFCTILYTTKCVCDYSLKLFCYKFILNLVETTSHIFTKVKNTGITIERKKPNCLLKKCEIIGTGVFLLSENVKCGHNRIRAKNLGSGFDTIRISNTCWILYSTYFREGVLWDELKESIQVFKSPDRTNLKQLLTDYKVYLRRS